MAPAPQWLLLASCLAKVCAGFGLLRPWLASSGLNQWPMLQAHDAGTGYLQPDGIITDVVYRFTKTQSGNVTSQLNCGIRAFDWRPSLTGDTLGFAHGPVFVNHSMESAAAEVVAWADAHASEAEDALVLLIVADCNGQACWDAASAAFGAVGLPVLSGDAGCATASNLTLGAAMTAAALPGGGHALALMNCPAAPVQTYDDRCSCTGFYNISEVCAGTAGCKVFSCRPSPPASVACVHGRATRTKLTLLSASTGRIPRSCATASLSSPARSTPMRTSSATTAPPAATRALPLTASSAST